MPEDLFCLVSEIVLTRDEARHKMLQATNAMIAAENARRGGLSSYLGDHQVWTTVLQQDCWLDRCGLSRD